MVCHGDHDVCVSGRSPCQMAGKMRVRVSSFQRVFFSGKRAPRPLPPPTKDILLLRFPQSHNVKQKDKLNLLRFFVWLL